MQKIHIEKTETIVEEPIVSHKIVFTINIDEIPQWDIIKNIPAVHNFIYGTGRNECKGSHNKIIFIAKGMATCMEQDSWDELKGKHIAITRAQENLHRTLERFYEGIFTAVNDLLGSIHHCIYHHWQKGFNCDVHLVKDILNNEDKKYLGYYSQNS